MGECMQKDNEAIVKHLAKIYKKLKQQCYDVNNLMMSEAYNEELAEAFEFVETIDAVLASMNEEEALILRFDYFENRIPKWYMNYFTRSTYYRIKTRAIDEFVRCVTA